MIKIYYHTHQGNDVIQAVEDLQQAAKKLEALFKARITARAFDQDGNKVGAVWKNNGKITWYCEEEI